MNRQLNKYKKMLEWNQQNGGMKETIRNLKKLIQLTEDRMDEHESYLKNKQKIKKHDKNRIVLE
ncbi:MAG TPA: hypothetical protein PK075_11920 [Chitinophagales bacterium]|nr:hypothetical protein [Chitinophagales bacterium]